MTDQDFLAALQAVLPAKAILTAPEDKAAFETDWRHIHSHAALCAALPDSTEQVAAVLKLCAEAGIGVVPQGGNTGLVAGAVPVAGGRQIVLSLKRMRKIRDFDSIGNTMTAEAGLTLREVQIEAAANAKLFPVSFGAEGTAQIGGIISTNAGGLQVLSYGSTRAQVLGLEVVLPDGRIWNGLRRLRKDNTGFDLKQIFIGGEGMLGIITAACLKLRPEVKTRATALAGIASLDDAVTLFQLLYAQAGEALTMCEFTSGPAMALSLAHLPNVQPPFSAFSYVLIEFSAHNAQQDVAGLLEQTLSIALEKACVTDVIIAQNERERDALIRTREGIAEGELTEGGAVKHDIAVPIGLIPETIRAVEALIAEKFPDCRLNVFGHIGDGNLHVNVRPPAGKTLQDLNERKTAITGAVERIAVERNGSFSAEHGIGQMRIAGMAAHKSPIELEMMRRLKQAFDPANILNPGKMLP
jgi:FAD/FMN-containing dehydrogenase